MYDYTAREEEDYRIHEKMQSDMESRKNEIEAKFNKHFDTYLGRYLAISLAGGAIRNWKDKDSYARNVWEAMNLELCDAYAVVDMEEQYSEIWYRRFWADIDEQRRDNRDDD